MNNIHQTSEDRIEKIRLKVENIVTENRNNVGTVNSIQEIEENLMSNLLSLGKLLLEDRIVAEEKRLEGLGYDIKGEKKRIKGTV
jgi:predicted RNA-binding protein